MYNCAYSTPTYFATMHIYYLMVLKLDEILRSRFQTKTKNLIAFISSSSPWTRPKNKFTYTPKIYFFLFYDTAERKLTNIFVLFYRRVRTLYACLGENDGELSFEPNQIITNGNYRKSMFYSSFSSFLHFYNFSFLFIIVYAWKSKTKQVNRFYTIQPY